MKVIKKGLLKRLKNNFKAKREQLDEIKRQGERQLETISSYVATNKSRSKQKNYLMRSKR